MERVHRPRGGVLARIRERRLVVNDPSGSDPRSHDERFVVESADEPADSTPFVIGHDLALVPRVEEGPASVPLAGPLRFG